MTREEREETIRCLSVHSSTNGSGLCTDEQHYKAKQMAIQALSQEPCVTESQMDEYIKNENPKLILSSVDENEYKDVLKEPCDDAISDIMGISKSRTHDIMENELRCVQRASCGGCDRECGECPLLMDDKEIIKAYGYVIRMLELPPVTQKSGKWLLTHLSNMAYCSECDYLFKDIPASIVKQFDFCPKCGCRMRGAE